MDQRARVVVHPVLDGERRVTVDGELVGRAVVADDVLELARLTGVSADRMSLRDPGVIEWREDGPETWNGA